MVQLTQWKIMCWSSAFVYKRMVRFKQPRFPWRSDLPIGAWSNHVICCTRLVTTGRRWKKKTKTKERERRSSSSSPHCSSRPSSAAPTLDRKIQALLVNSSLSWLLVLLSIPDLLFNINSSVHRWFWFHWLSPAIVPALVCLIFVFSIFGLSMGLFVFLFAFIALRRTISKASPVTVPLF